MLPIHIDRDAERSLYKQISEQIIDRIEGGYLPRGSRLPTIRDLAGQLGVTRVTVHSAYNELREAGWIEATVGRGTFVSGPLLNDPMEAVSSEITPAAVMRDMGRLHHIRDIRMMAMAEPSTDLHPTSSFLRELHGVSRHATGLFDYACSLGSATLRHQIAAILADLGVDTRPELIQVTAGATQALSIVTDVLADSGDTVLVEEPTYLGMLAILQARGIRAVGVPLDESGPDLDVLEALVVRERPRFFYTIPDFQNPTGVSMAADRRRDLLEIAGRARLRIVEDSVYRRLAYDGAAARPLKAHDTDGLVVYVDSFSKSLLPGLRVGYIAAPAEIHDKVRSLFRVTELCGQPLIHHALAEFLAKGRYDQHLRDVIPDYRARRDAMLAALDEHMPEEVFWTRPAGGFCCWLRLPDGARFDDLYAEALHRRIAFTPGEVFYATPPPATRLRLCFGHPSIEHIESGVADLGALIARRLQRDAVGERPVAEVIPLI